MDGVAARRLAILLLSPLVGSVLLSFGFTPLSKIWIVVGEVAVGAFILLCLGIHDLMRRVPYRPAIPQVWFTLAAGLGCFSMGLRTMAQTWGMRLAHLPIMQMNGWFGAGILLLILGGVGFLVAIQQRVQMSQPHP